MASKLTTRTSTKRDRKAGPVRQVAPPTNGHQPASDLAHTCSCSCGRTWAPRAAKPAHACGCEPGCQATTKRTYAQGHDAKALAFVRKLRAAGGKPESKADKARVAHLSKAGLLTGLVAHLS
ncbi:hypothetical protein LCGC14_1181790 [marine sediment metagenome]|uniref:Uncharacterized protein n=1 Tax=marine sediment metagenome TaxID=412755 RepID=A0A0F9PSD9_9ZZZZ